MGIQQPTVLQPGQIQPGQILFPEHQVLVQSFDNSFERATPQLPAQFEYNGLKYIDTARVEPRIAYPPEKTPPKTPETPHFSHTPFIPPLPSNQQCVINPDPVWPQPGQTFEMTEIPAGPIATSEKKFELEHMDGSPGNTLRERNRRINSPPTSPIQDEMDSELQPRVEMLQESPGAGRNRRVAESNQLREKLSEGESEV